MSGEPKWVNPMSESQDGLDDNTAESADTVGPMESDSPTSSPAASRATGRRASVSMEVEKPVERKKSKIASMANKAVTKAVDTGAAAVKSAGGMAKKSEDVSQARNLRKFMDLNVFTSTEEADRLEAEQAKLERVKWCGILHPETGTSIVYNQMHIIFLMYMMAVLPVRTAFQITPGVSDWDFWADVVVDTSIGIDIILNFSRYYYERGMLVTDPLTIRRHYLRSWFIIDLCSALPFNYIVLLVEHSEDDANLSRTTRFMRLTRIMRFARLLKLAKLTQLRDAIDTFQKFLNNVGISAMEVEFFLRQIGLVFVLLCAIHLVGCIWLHVGRSGATKLDADGNPAPEGWMTGQQLHLNADGTTLDNVYIHEQYVDAVYWAIVTMSSVGYGDVLPVTTSERTIAIFVIVLGAFLYAYIIGAFSTIMAHNDYDKARYDTKIRQVLTWLKFIDADPVSIERTLKFYEYRFQNKLMFDDHKIVEELPVKLQTDLVLHRFEKTIATVPFFKNLREDTMVAICMQFHQFAVMPGDYITHRGDPYRELLVLTKGVCRTVPEGHTGSESPRSSPRRSQRSATIGPIDAVVEYSTGSFFGELEFLGLSDERSNDIRAKIYCELSSLHPKDVAHVVQDSTQLQNRLHKYVELKTELATLAADGELNEMEAERIKEELEDSFGNEVEGEASELTAEEMRMMMGDEKDDTKKILLAVQDISARLAKLEERE